MAKYWQWFAGFVLIMLLSVLIAGTVLDHMPGLRDVTELLRPLVYAILLFIGRQFQVDARGARHLIRCFLGYSLVSACIGYVQYVGAWGVNQIITPWYTVTQLRGVLEHHRIIGTFSNPNEFGAFMVLAASFALSGALLSERRITRMVCWALLGAFGAATAMTGSRSALVSLFILGCSVLGLAAPIAVGIRRTFGALAGAVVVVAIVAAVIGTSNPSLAVSRLSQLANIQDATSWQGRIEDWENDFQIWLASPITGWGPAEADMESTVDNEWLLILRRYGVVGLCWFVAGMVGVAVSLLRGLRRAQAISGKILAMALLGVMPAYAFYMFFAAVYHAPQLMPPLMLLLGAAGAQLCIRSSSRKGAVQCM